MLFYDAWHLKNDASTSNSSDIVNNILKLRLFISQKLPNTNVVLSKPIIKVDTTAAKVIIEEVNKQLNNFDFNMIDNSNLSRAHMNSRGLYLNTRVCYSLKKSDLRYSEIMKY